MLGMSKVSCEFFPISATHETIADLFPIQTLVDSPIRNHEPQELLYSLVPILRKLPAQTFS
jgi:hypothetical protein